MRLVYFGTADFAIAPLLALASHIVLVVSQPDRPSGRGMELRPSPVKFAADSCGLKVLTPERSRAPEFVDILRGCNADALVVAAYGQILSQAVLDSARQGGINLHASILPKYRGAAPIQRAILAGETETGVTLMQMDKGMDTGDIIEIGTHPIGPDDTAADVTRYLTSGAAELALEWMPRICAGDYPRTPQDHDKATVAPKVQKAEAELKFERPAQAEYNRWRAFTPSPGPFVRTRFGLVRIGKARLGTNEGPPGVVVSTSPSCEIAFAGGSIQLLEVQPEGKKRMSGKDFANGNRLRPGDSLIDHAT